MALTNDQKLIVQSMYLLNGKSIDEIAKHLETTPKVIENYLSKVADSYEKVIDKKAKEAAPVAEAEPEKPRRRSSKDGMLHRTAGKGRSGVTIMTEGASQRTDAKRNAKRNHSDKSNKIFIIDKNKKD